MWESQIDRVMFDIEYRIKYQCGNPKLIEQCLILNKE